jgi:hypothetical protein
MMKALSFLLIGIFSVIITSAQPRMRTLEELVNREDPGWKYVELWIKEARNSVEVLPVDTLRASKALYSIQVSTRSPMGAIVYMTGGLLVDHGWIRILGSGSEKLSRTLSDWNLGKTVKGLGDKPPYLIIADDVLGGFFLLNGGALGKDVGKVYYFAPETLEYEPLDLTYTEFLQFCFNSNLDEFYGGYRWLKWKEEVEALSADKVFNFYPMLWTKEGKDINKLSRRAVPVDEQYSLNMSLRKQLGIER